MIVEEKFITLDGDKIYCCVAGNGPHVVLFMQAIIMHCRSALKHQIENFDHDKYTIVAWDPPGYGKSSPEQMLPPNFQFRNAELGYKLMKNLNFEYYSVCCICGGGPAGMILAAKHPEVIRSLILSDTKSHMTARDAEITNFLEDLKNGLTEYVKGLFHLYGEELTILKWENVITNNKIIWKYFDGNICSHLLEDIKCPTLILGGDKDKIVEPSQAYYLHKHIKGSLVYVDPEGRHTFQHTKPEEFNRRVTEFLSEVSHTVKNRI